VAGGIFAGIAWLLIVGAAFRVRPTWWSWGQDKRPTIAPTAPVASGDAGSAVTR
jgi:hypothetical protein